MADATLEHSILGSMLDCRSSADEWRNNRLIAETRFYELWQKLSPIIAEKKRKTGDKLPSILEKIKAPKHIPETILDIICEDDMVFLENGVMRFTDRDSLWTLINEILINESYYFSSETESPRILDCGSSYGMSLYYFKSLYPEAMITGFEPVTEFRELAIENMRVNGYKNVEVLRYAVSAEAGPAKFHVSKTYPMAGSLTERRKGFGDEIKERTVQCRRLSTYLDEPVHFLKLDIEGKEDTVLEEARDGLKNVRHLFCEYHHGMGLPTNRLAKILMLLDECGFDVHVGKSFNFQRNSEVRPMSWVNGPYSVEIWARNRNRGD